MIEALSYPDEPFTDQLNVRMRHFTRLSVDRLARINGETKQVFFDRLVAEEYERHVVENSDEMIAENQTQIAAIEADTAEIQAILETSRISQ